MLIPLHIIDYIIDYCDNESLWKLTRVNKEVGKIAHGSIDFSEYYHRRLFESLKDDDVECMQKIVSYEVPEYIQYPRRKVLENKLNDKFILGMIEYLIHCKTSTFIEMSLKSKRFRSYYSYILHNVRLEDCQGIIEYILCNHKCPVRFLLEILENEYYINCDIFVLCLINIPTFHYTRSYMKEDFSSEDFCPLKDYIDGKYLGTFYYTTDTRSDHTMFMFDSFFIENSSTLSVLLLCIMRPDLIEYLIDEIESSYFSDTTNIEYIYECILYLKLDRKFIEVLRKVDYTDISYFNKAHTYTDDSNMISNVTFRDLVNTLSIANDLKNTVITVYDRVAYKRLL